MTTRHTISECLATLEISVGDLSQCESLEKEFVVIKKSYFRKVLTCHPDKGGDASIFRTVHASFEALRDLYDHGRVEGSFVSASTSTTSTTMDETMWQTWQDMPMQSWEYFYTAAEEDVPLYLVELARSGRSGCKQQGTAKRCDDPTIAKGEIRVGSMDQISGTYGRWNHLACWRVPSKVWLGMPNPDDCDDPEQFEMALLGMNEVLLCGFSALPRDDKDAFIAHVMDKGNWARKTVRKKTNPAAIVPVAASAPASNNNSREVVPEGYHKAREEFVVPVPGRGGVSGVLEGKTVVLTGVFPEVGGGRGLELGKAKVKAMIESFGGRVTGSISGRTDLLVVGQEPGRSKVSKAEAAKKCKLISLKDLKEVVEGALLEDVANKPLLIPSFSAGYPGARRITASADVTGAIVVNTTNADEDKKPAAKRKKSEDDDEKKPAAKKRKAKAPSAAKKNRKATTAKKKTTKKAGKNKSAETDKEHVGADALAVAEGKEDESSSEGFHITCDACGRDCTAESWHVEETEEDFCADCRGGRGVAQCNGLNMSF